MNTRTENPPMYWGENYDLANQTLTRIGRPHCDFMTNGDYVITKYGYVVFTRINNGNICLCFIAANVQFHRWIHRDYSDRYMVTICKRFAEECHQWIYRHQDD